MFFLRKILTLCKFKGKKSRRLCHRLNRQNFLLIRYQSARVPTTPPFNNNNSNNSNNPLPTMGFDQLTNPPPGQKTTPVPTGVFYSTPTKSPGIPTNTPRPQPSSTPKPTATRSRPQLLHTSDQDQACGKFSKTSVKESVFQPLF